MAISKAIERVNKTYCNEQFRRVESRANALQESKQGRMGDA